MRGCTGKEAELKKLGLSPIDVDSENKVIKYRKYYAKMAHSVFKSVKR